MMKNGDRQARTLVPRHRLVPELCPVALTVAALSFSWVGANAGEAAAKPAYQLTVGLVVLESEAPEGDSSGAGEFYVRARRDDPVISRELEAVNNGMHVLGENRADIRCLIDKLDEAQEPRPETGADGSKEPDRDSAGWTERIDDDALAKSCEISEIGRYLKRDATTDRPRMPSRELALLHEQLEDFAGELATLQAKADELSSLLTGRTATVSTREHRMHFTDAPILMVYERDRVLVTLTEDDFFQDDLYGRKTFVIDEAMLNSGHVELDTGWVERLRLGFVPLE